MTGVAPTEPEDGNQQVPAFYKRRRRRGDELGQILLRHNRITPEQLRAALRKQTEEGGHLGAILRRMGACDSRAIAEALLEQVRVTRDKGKARETEARAREAPSLMGLSIYCRPRLTKLLIVFSDVLGLGLGTGLSWLLVTHDAPGRVQRYGILAVLPLCLLIFTYLNLYAATPPSPPEEIRRTTLSVTFVCAGLWLVSFLVRSGGWDGVQHLAWLLVWIIGVFTVPVLGGLELAPVLSQRLKVRFAVVAMPEADSAALLSIIERYAESFQSVLAIPDLFDLAFFGAATRDLGGVLGIEVRRQLLLTGPRLAKRLMDVGITGTGLLLVSPLLLIIALMIKLDSRGPVFYRQKRLGQDGVRFPAFKFRSMHGDGERRLAEVLAKDPKLRAEYDAFHKLTDDPRVTRVGRFLRKYSLDELPQLLNVLLGDMSLVGPRPYLEREIPEMEQKEAIILRVKPGITGIWQVTERNASTFERRLHMDVEYVRSWSPWLDIYVMARTIPVVLGGTGS